MTQRSRIHTPPPWARPGNRWGPRLYWPMLCLSIGLTAWRIMDGDDVSRVLPAAVLVLIWAWLLIANRTARRRQARTQE
ncbi:hypothetical protein [Streptomyces sp. NPDC093598]|uniref:hypothetical protein n=1 Tax=Streptomyces sp. NPDC093598 TaxID=3366046 RepID=UPI0038194FDF